MHFNMLKSIIVDKKRIHLLYKDAKYKNVFIFNDGFAMKERPVPFFHGAHSCVL
jgi:hypothetical protein